jgi:hypothetical protein
MSRAEQYMNLAAEVRAKAELEDSPIIRAEWENLAETYVRLAEQSEGASTRRPMTRFRTCSTARSRKRRSGEGRRTGEDTHFAHSRA